MIVRNENAKNRQFKGVSFDVLAVGKQSMVTRMNYKAGDSYSVPMDVPHSWEVILPGEVIDVFTPIREDYL